MANIEKNNMGFLGADYQYKLVSAFVTDGKFFKDIYRIVEQNAFTEPCLKGIVGVMKDYYSRTGNVPSYDLIQIELNAKLVHTEEDKEYYEETIDKLKRTSCEGREEIENLGLEFFKQQEVIRCANEMLQSVSAGASMDEVSKYEDELKDIFSVKRRDDNVSTPFESMDEDLSKDSAVYVPFGISLLDEALGGGLEKGKMCLIIGPTGFGKTSMTTCVAANAATYRCKDNNFEGYKGIQFIFEDTHRDIHRKYFSKISQIETADINKDEETTEKVRAILNNSSEREMLDNNIRIIRLESGEYSASDIGEIVKRKINEGFKPDFIVIDYFECLAPERGTSKLDITDRESRSMRKLENLAPELDIAILLPTQGNRESLISQLVTIDKSGGSIKKGQISQIVISISRTPDQKKNNAATISLLKNRGGRDTIVLENIYFNNGTCTINCEQMVEFDEPLEYNDFATEKEREIEKEKIRQARKEFNLRQN